MKLEELFEMRRGSAKELAADAKEAGKVKKANDLTPYVNKVRDARGLEAKKDAAREMAKHFSPKLGQASKDRFLGNVEKASNEDAVMKLAYNAMLSGEGLAARRAR
jgi:hypothetical protein